MWTDWCLLSPRSFSCICKEIGSLPSKIINKLFSSSHINVFFEVEEVENNAPIALKISSFLM